MTEAEWLVCENPLRMLRAISDSIRERQARLFGCACCRHIWGLLPDESKMALEISERSADGLATRKECDLAFKQAEAVALARGRPWQPDALTYAMASVPGARAATAVNATSAADTAASAAASAAGDTVQDDEYDSTFDRTLLLEHANQARLIHDIFGNPFRPVSLDSLWLTFDVQALAKGIYDERAFDRMPILADALQDAGCDNTDVLNHCRDTNQVHVRGCWVLDLLLGKG
jgi:hypothetical protein